MSTYSLRLVAIFTFLMILGVGSAYAQRDIPTVRADTVDHQHEQIDYDFSKSHPTGLEPNEEDLEPHPAYYIKGEFEPDTLPAGNMVKVDLATGEKTIIEHDLPKELPESAYTKGRKGIAAFTEESRAPFKKGDERMPGTQKFSQYSQVSNPAADVYRKAVQLFIQFPNTPAGKASSCSGTLVDEEWVLTAGHCVNESSQGGDATNIVVIPANSVGNTPYGRANAKSTFYFQNWDGDNNWNSDMALVQLDRPVGVITGYYPFGYESKPFYQDKKFWVYSYPAEQGYNGNFMYKMSGTWDFGLKTWIFKPGANREKLAHNGGVVVGGSSGGGALAKKNGSRRVYAVVSHGPKLPSGKSISPEYYTRVTSSKHSTMTNVIQNTRFGETDLVALHTRLSSNTIVEGKTLQQVKFTVFNRGTNWTGEKDWDFDIYLSNDANIDKSDTHLGSYTFRYEFQGRDALNVWRDVDIPLGSTGDKFVGIILDVSDKNAGNNNTEGWDSADLKVKKSRDVKFISELKDGTDLTDIPVDVSPWDLQGQSYGKTDLTYKYAPGTEIYFNTFEYAGVYKFVRWEKGGSTFTNKEGEYFTVQNNETFKAIFEIPAVPVKPHEIRARLPEKHTQSDETATLKIVNKHNSRIDWSISELNGSSWLSVSPTSGSTYPGAMSTVTVTMSSDYLSQGGYRDHLVISDGNGNSSRVQVDLAVGPPPGTAPTPEEVHKAIAVAELMENLGFGMGLDIDGTPDERFMGVGASGPTTQPGHVYTKLMVDGKWSAFTEVMPEQRIEGDRFGATVDVVANGNDPLLVAGAPGMGPDKPKATVQQTYSGRVDLFRHNGDGWMQAFSLPLGEELAAGAQFGASVATHPDPSTDGQQFIAIGAPNAMNSSGERTGKVFVYKYILGDLAGHSVITPQEAVPNDFFGKSMEFISTGYSLFLVVGAPGQEGSKQTGRALVYRYNGESWYLYQTLTPEKAQAGDLVGSAVASNRSAEEPLIALGAPGADLTSENSGGIFTYRYTLKTENWQPVSVIQPNIETPQPQFGQTLKMHKVEGSTILMAGAPATGNTKYGGEAQIYRKVDGDDEWLFRSRLRPEIKDVDAAVGRSLAMAPINGKLRFFAGAPGLDVEGVSGVGQAYQFELQDPITLPQLTLGQEMIRTDVPQEQQAQEQLEIRSTGKAALTWSLELDHIPWVSAEADSGTIQAGSTESITLNFNAAALDTGLYRRDILLQTNDTNRDCTYIAMELNVTDQPTGDLALGDMLVESPDSVGIGNMLGQNVEAYLYNSGREPVDSTISVGLYISSDEAFTGKDSLFATTQIDTGLAAGEGTMVSLPRGALVPGDLQAGSAYLFMVADYGDEIPELNEENNMQAVPVTLVNTPQPKFSLATETGGFDLTLKQNESIDKTVELTNTGKDTLYYSVPWFASFSASATYAPQTTVADTTVPAYLAGVSPAVGEVAPGDTSFVILSFNGEGVETGSYQDTMAIVTNDPENTVVMVPVDVTVEEGTPVEQQQPVPDDFALKQNYPNPFNPATQIRYELPKSAHVTLSIYNMLGRRIATLVDDQRAAGVHRVTFEAGDLPSGAYIYRIKAGSYTETRKMMLLK